MISKELSRRVYSYLPSQSRDEPIPWSKQHYKVGEGKSMRGIADAGIHSHQTLNQTKLWDLYEYLYYMPICSDQTHSQEPSPHVTHYEEKNR